MNEKNKYFVFSDVHGEFDALMESLREAGFDPHNNKHYLVSLGDNFDRGPKSREIYQFLTSSPRIICIKGNHDEMLEEFVEKGSDGEFVLMNLLHNGLYNTINSFSGPLGTSFKPNQLDAIAAGLRDNAGVLNFLKKMPLYFETKNFIFSHAGVDPGTFPDWKDTDRNHFLWDIENSWDPCKRSDKLVVIGHHHASRVRKQAMEYRDINCPYRLQECYHTPKGDKIYMKEYGNSDENAIFQFDNKIAIDGCTNITHKVNVLVVEDYPVEEKSDNNQKTNVEDPSVSGIRVSNDGLTYTFTGRNYNTFYTQGDTLTATTGIWMG